MRVLVTGVSEGIGGAICRQIADTSGSSIAMCVRRMRPEVEALAAELRSRGCNAIVALTAAAARSVRMHEVEDTVAVLLRFECGALGTITATDASPSPWSWDANSGENPAIPASRENSYRFLGSEGSLEFPDLHLWRYRVSGEPGWTRPISREGRVVPPEDAYRRQLRHFCQVINGHEEPLVGAEDARRTLQVTAAILRSAATGQTVDPFEMREAA